MSRFTASPGRAMGLVALAALAFGAALMVWAGTPPGDSYDFNLAWADAFAAALAAGDPYPRHLPGLSFGLGGLDFFFYAPLPFYVAAGPGTWLCPGCSAQQAFAMTGALIWLASAAAFWGAARLFVPAGAALGAAAVYAFLPYHMAADWMIRQAVGEFAAYVFAPLMVRGMVLCLRDRRLGLAFPLGFAGMLLSHLPSALLAAHVFGVLFLLWAMLHPRQAWGGLWRLGVMAGTGLALAGLYWLPALVLIGDVSPQALYEITLLQPARWLYFGDMGLPSRNRLEIVNFTAFVTALVIAATAIACRPRQDVLIWVLAPVLLCAALNTAPTLPLWENWILNRVQFPFRLLLFVDVAAALGAAVLLDGLMRAQGDVRARLLPLSGLAACAVAFAITGYIALRALPEARDRIGAPVAASSVPEYYPPAFYAAVTAEAATRSDNIWLSYEVVEDWATTWRAQDADMADAAILWPEATPRHWRITALPAGPSRLAVPYWRHLKAETEDGAPVALSPDPEFGLVRIDLAAPAEVVDLRLPWHWSETAGLGLSAVGLLGLGAIAATRRRPRVQNGP